MGLTVVTESRVSSTGRAPAFKIAREIRRNHNACVQFTASQRVTILVLSATGLVQTATLIGETSEVEKEYLVRVEGRLADEGMRKLQHGLTLDGVTLRPAQVSWQNENQLRFVLREGRKRQIRRMCELVGLKVVGLKRVRMGSITLGKLPLGQWRFMRPDERF